jgi:hypothetical protein
VSSTSLEPIEGTNKGVLSVLLEIETTSSSEYPAPKIEAVTYECDWVAIERAMLEHPHFIVGGSGSGCLDDEDVVNVEAWKNEKDASLRREFKFSNAQGTATTLSSKAIYFAKGVNLGVETWTDYRPVLRKTTVYKDAPPPSTGAGSKTSSISFPGGPTGYQWVKTCDRFLNSGSRNKWERSEEWTGMDRVLADKNYIYW